MKRLFSMATLFAILATGVVSGTAVRADEEITLLKAQGNPYLNDFTIWSGKRSDLRINLIQKGRNRAFSEWLRSERPLAYREFAARQTRDELTNETSFVRAQGNPYLIDFMVWSGKRSDLRMEVVRKGVDAAFAEWMQREHPNVSP